MKRHCIRLADIAATDNLTLAVWKAARSKRHRPDVIRFTTQLDQHLQQLAQDIVQAKVPYARYREFYIHDPKERLIHAACFEDRVLHHAIMNLAEPVFERALVPTTYACRPDKGVHRAVAQVQANLRRYPWYVKTDISGYFPSIDHQILHDLLQRRFKITELALQQAYQSVHAITLHADSLAWRKQNSPIYVILRLSAIIEEASTWRMSLTIKTSTHGLCNRLHCCANASLTKWTGNTSSRKLRT